MKKMTEMTFAEAKKYVAENNERLQAMYDKAPEIDSGYPGRFIGRGFAVIKDYINKNGRPRVDDPKQVVSIRLPASAIKSLRQTGRGWQTRASEYLVKGIQRGILGTASN
jgi:uncharacterized protein (DUF4415 family)